ncbi:hypothetical protein [Patulibacter medicamentivorans]|uniref:hypothetical protein n=1 Tax=Patulibacter medicamentivorans TaxID=1097667 RepID=UPI00058F0DC1|nr:hypothetical protein [Patulibacter medicamentivorans]
MTHDHETPATTIRDGIARAVGVVGISGIGLIHLLDAPGKYAETPYMFWMYIALILGCIAVAGELIRSGSLRRAQRRRPGRRPPRGPQLARPRRPDLVSSRVAGRSNGPRRAAHQPSWRPSGVRSSISANDSTFSTPRA